MYTVFNKIIFLCAILSFFGQYFSTIFIECAHSGLEKTDITLAQTSNETESDTLVLVHTIFRHGQRTNDESVREFANNKNTSYAPYGWGQLTNEGKVTEYKLGQFLRRRYGKFLGKFHPTILRARSTHKERSKLSLQLVLASLFPPEDDLVWNTTFNWQPVVYDTPTSPDDLLLYPTVCSNYLNIFDEYASTPEIRKEMIPFNDTIHIINNNNKFTLDPIDLDIVTVQSYLTIEDEFGLELPEWSKLIYPEPINTLVRMFFKIAVGTIEMKRIILGTILKKIVEDSKGKIDNELNYKEKKIYLYSSHDISIGPLLSGLGYDHEKLPIYGACIMMELHKINNEYGFKIYYKNDESDKPELLKLPNCESFCSLDKFIMLHQDFFANENTICSGLSNDILNKEATSLLSNTNQILLFVGIIIVIISVDVLFLLYIKKKYMRNRNINELK